LSNVLNHLLKFLSDYNTEAIDFLEREEEVFTATELRIDYDTITEALNIYDFEKAVSIVEQTAKKYNIDLG